MKMTHTSDVLEAKDCKLSQSSFDDVDLSATVFLNVNLRGSKMDDVNLAGSTITNANCRDLSISDSALDGMTIDGILVTDLLKAYNKPL